VDRQILKDCMTRTCQTDYSEKIDLISGRQTHVFIHNAHDGYMDMKNQDLV